jgi:hypothetical protein
MELITNNKRMINKRYNGVEEFSRLLKSFPAVPNTEIVEKTAYLRVVSEIMNGIRPRQKKFIEKFKKGFKIGDTMETIEEKTAKRQRVKR